MYEPLYRFYKLVQIVHPAQEPFREFRQSVGADNERGGGDDYRGFPRPMTALEYGEAAYQSRSREQQHRHDVEQKADFFYQETGRMNKNREDKGNREQYDFYYFFHFENPNIYNCTIIIAHPKRKCSPFLKKFTIMFLCRKRRRFYAPPCLCPHL
jgi:hypothetical protein